MDSRPLPPLHEQFAAAQDWWREAGVDCDFADEPKNWLASECTKAQSERTEAPNGDTQVGEPPPQIPLAPAPAPLGGDRSSWPQSLDQFAPWWLASGELETGGTEPRVAPRGVAQAELMVLVPMPEEGDAERLLAGPQGRLVGSMLAAMGVAEDQAYVAAALPRHARHPDWAALAEREWGEVVVHHVRLVRPQRLLILGRAMLPLFGHDPAQAGAKPRPIALQGCDVPALASFGPEALLATPRFRAGLWRGWLEWTEGNA